MKLQCIISATATTPDPEKRRGIRKKRKRNVRLSRVSTLDTIRQLGVVPLWSCLVDKRTPSLRSELIPPGPRSRESVQSILHQRAKYCCSPENVDRGRDYFLHLFEPFYYSAHPPIAGVPCGPIARRVTTEVDAVGSNFTKVLNSIDRPKAPVGENRCKIDEHQKPKNGNARPNAR